MERGKEEGEGFGSPRGEVGLFNTGSGSRALLYALFSLQTLRTFSNFTHFPLFNGKQGYAGAGCGFRALEMQPATQILYAPTFGGQASSLLDYEQRGISRDGSTDIPPEKRPTLLILHMDATARRVCLCSGGDTLMEGDDGCPDAARLFPT